jgi:glycosyltransferase involved in cell wall biosynthesis
MSRILVVDNSTYPTGAIRSILGLTRLLRPRHEFVFAMDARGGAAQLVREHGFEVHDLRFEELSKSPRALFYPWRLFGNARRLRRLAHRTGASLLHVNDLYNLAGLVAAGPGRRLPVLQHARLLRSSYLGPIHGLLSRIVRARADAVVAVSRQVQDELGGATVAELVPDALATPARHPPKQWRTDLWDCRFLLVGNYVAGKGHDLAIRAFSRICRTVPAATLRLVGGGADGALDPDFVAMLRTLVAESGCAGRIVLDGPTDDVEATMKDADVVLALSDSESFSMVCLEALSFGLPLVATDCGGPGELIEPGVTGVLVPVGDVASTAEAMLRLATDPAWAERLGKAAAERTPRRYDPADSAHRLDVVYQRLLAR